VADPAAGWTVGRLAAALGGTVDGDASRPVTGVSALSEAGPDQVSFLANRRYTAAFRDSAAGCVLVGPRERVPEGRTVIRVADPYAAFAAALRCFHPERRPAPGVDPRAHVAPDATVDGATIEAFAWVGPGAVVGPGTWVEAGAVVGPGAVVGRDARLMPHSVVCAGCVLGDRVWLNPGAVVGGEGFGFAPTAEGNQKIPQVGRAVLEDDVELGANACVDRAALGQTVVRRGAKLDNLTQVGHAAEVGEHALMVAYSGVAGSAKLGRRVALGARGTVLGHIEVGDGVQVGVGGVLHRTVPAGQQVSGVPAMPHKTWLRAASSFKELPELVREVRRLSARVAELEARLADATGGSGAID
jgi:UDP-3-O-[3-hydroxymyristoyl] glucosamine N-acyltransferase